MALTSIPLVSTEDILLLLFESEDECEDEVRFLASLEQP